MQCKALENLAEVLLFPRSLFFFLFHFILLCLFLICSLLSYYILEHVQWVLRSLHAGLGAEDGFQTLALYM